MASRPGLPSNVPSGFWPSRFDIQNANLPFPQIEEVVGIEELFAAPKLELAQEVGSQVASSANLLPVDTEVVERLSAPAENELQNVVNSSRERSSGTENPYPTPEL